MSPHAPIRALAAAFLPTGCREGLLLMLRAYFDDSGTDKNSRVVTVGGLIGSVTQWEFFERAWAKRLADPIPGYNKPRLKAFHLTHCKARVEEFAGYTEGESDAVRHDFRHILISSNLAGTASSIDKWAWDELAGKEVRSYIGDCVNLCVENCLAEAMKLAGGHADGDVVAAIFDRGFWNAAGMAAFTPSRTNCRQRE